MIIYRLTDRIPVKVGELTFWLSPLSTEQKGKLSSFSSIVSGEKIEDALKAAAETIRMSVKQVDGLKDAQGNAYEVELGPDGLLTSECVSELTQLDGCDKIVRLAVRWGMNDIKNPEAMRAEHEASLLKMRESGKITDQVYNEAMKIFPMDGVTVDFSKIQSVKKKSSAPPLV